MTILVVEDEAKTAAFLRRGLDEHGFSPHVVGSSSEALRAIHHQAFDAAILDVGLPDGDGFTLFTAMRAAGYRLPILFLTARDAVSDRVHGLELGADDYLIKPFAFSELLARIRTMLRRGTHPTSALRHGDLEIDLIRQRAFRQGRRLDLTSTDFTLLAMLVRHAGEALSRRFLAEQVWDMHVESDTNVVDVGIRRLRAKVDDPFPTTLIHTVRGVGYVLGQRA